MITTSSSQPGQRAIVWFRKDLRLADHPALDAALQTNKEIIPVFIWDEEEGGNWSPGAASRWWLHHSLASLGSSIAKLGGSLILARGKAAQILPGLAQAHQADQVFYGRCYDPAGIATQEAVEEACDLQGINTDSFNSSLLQEPWETKNGTGKPFQVFTPYWRKSRPIIYREAAGYSVNKLTFAQGLSAGSSLDSLGLLPEHPWHNKLGDHWEVSENAAHRQIERTVEEVTHSYATRRNHPSVDGTSRLSPYLAWGQVSPRQICQAVLQAESEGSHRGENKFLVEIGWREFSYHLLYHFPNIPDQPLRPKYAKFPWLDDPENLKRWQFGKTGYPMVDAGMRQLYETGWMHNRVRMVVASFLVKHLLLPWQEGARWFWDTLVDADLASNTQGWQWAAGCGADAAPYFRIFNPITQGDKFDARGEYARRWIPELEKVPKKFVFSPWMALSSVLTESGVSLGENYPDPCVDHSEARARALAALATLKQV
jgi:deoxyribodipyrimidine photo-lyase